MKTEKMSMMRFSRSLAVALLLVVCPVATAFAQGDGFEETIVVPLSQPGQPARVSVAVTSGGITVEAYDGREVIVETSTGLETLEEGEESEAEAGGLRRLPNNSLKLVAEENDNHVEIWVRNWNRAADLRLRVPVQTSLELKTVNNGDIVIQGVDGEHELNNVNGSIEARGVSGSVVASTTNGDVDVELVRPAEDKPMAFSSLNGDVEIELPADTRVTLRLRSDRGDILTDFDVDLSRRPPKVETSRDGDTFRVEVEGEVYGTIGGGGAELTVKTYNGDIVIRQRG